MRIWKMKCFFVVCIKVYPIFFRRDFFIEEDGARETKKISSSKRKKRQQKQHARDERAQKKNKGEIQRDFETRDTVLRENKRAIFYSFFEMLLF
jgi:hypothetical protein